ncbi:hypothetical protein JCM16303_004086 [Sporobolomyces ruberrimus]
MHLVPKHTKPGDPPKYRIIEHASHPKKPLPSGVTSVNHNLDPNQFKCSWTGLDQIKSFFLPFHDRREVRVLGLDFRNGFEHVGVDTKVRHRLCLSWKGKIYVRKVAPFGVRTTPGEFGNLVDATKEILEKVFAGRLKVINQVDDLAIAFIDPTLKLEEVLELLKELGWEVNEEKTQALTRKPIHDGIEWDLDELTMSLPKEKKEKYRLKVVALLRKGKKHGVTLKEVESLVGSLQYVCRIVPKHRTNLRPLYRLRNQFHNEYATRHLENQHLKTLDWWNRFLSSPRISSSFGPPPPLLHGTFACDASNVAIGIFLQLDGSSTPLVAKFDLDPTWREKHDAYIGNAEAWSVEALVEALVRLGVRNRSVRIVCDNSNVDEAWSKGWSKNALLNLSIVRLLDLSFTFNLYLTLDWIESAKNPADAISRNVFPSGTVQLDSSSRPFNPPGSAGGSDPRLLSTKFMASLQEEKEA